MAPVSSKVKDTHLMASAHACVTLPKHGRGSHPENGTLALDGRSRNLLAWKGTCSNQEEQKGNLYWVVTRTSVAKEANLEFDNCSFQNQIKVTLPAAKKRKIHASEWDSAELPSLPVLVNKKAITKHTRLMVFQAEKKKDDKEKKPAKK